MKPAERQPLPESCSVPERPSGPIQARVGRIRIEKVLAQGGMGEVYLGTDDKLGRRVAVKSIRHDRLRQDGQAADLRARLLREARLLSRLSHPHICQIHDFIEGNDRDHLVLEYIEGRTLKELAADGLDPHRAATVAEGVADALAAAHRHGVVHRDLKPENVMVTADGQVKILDFGVARMTELEVALAEGRSADADPDIYADANPPDLEPETSPEATAPGRLLATPRFMSPEQARGEVATAASDMYSFGLLLQEIFTGRPAHDPQLGAAEVVMRTARGISEPVVGIDADLASLLERLKAFAPSDRPTAVDTLEYLRARRRKALARLYRRLLVAAAVALLLIAILTSVLAWRLAQTAETAEREARHALSQSLGAQSAAHRDDDLDLALLLGHEAWRVADHLDSRSALLNALEAQPRLERFFHHDSRALTVSWSAALDLVATGSADGLVRLWHPDGRLATAPMAGHGAHVWSVAWNPAGDLLASAGVDWTIRFWNAGGEPDGPPLQGHTAAIWSLAWSPDGALLASASSDLGVRLWDVARRRQHGAALSGHELEIYEVAWSPDGMLLASAGAGGTVRLWDAASGRPALAPIRGYAGEIAALAFHPQRRWLAIGGGEKTVWLWDLERAALVTAPLVGHENGLDDLQWSPDGRQLASSAVDGTVRLWELGALLDASQTAGRRTAARRRVDSRVLRGHGARVGGLSWSPDGHFLVSASDDHSAAVWTAGAGYYVGQPLRGHRSAVLDVALHPTAPLAASVGADLSVVVWDLESGREQTRFAVERGAVMCVAWSPDGRFLATGGEDQKIRLWSAALASPAATLIGHADMVADLSWSPDGRYLASAGWDGAVRLWNVAAAEEHGPPLIGHAGRVLAVAWSPVGDLLAAAGDGGEVLLWDGDAREIRARLAGHEDAVEGLAFSPDGALLASGSHDHTIRLWNVATGHPASAPLIGHAGQVRDLAWSADGLFLASAGSHKAILLWEVRKREAFLRLERHRGIVRGLSWSAAGRLLASGGQDGTVVARAVETDPAAWRREAQRRAGRDLTAAERRRFLGPVAAVGR